MTAENSLQIVPLDLGQDMLARELLAIQHAAYGVEAELVGSDAIPPLHETLEALVACGETFLGAFDGDVLVGAVSWRLEHGVLDLHRLVVSPAAFRRGIGGALVRAALALHPGRPAIVQTGAANAPARALYTAEGFTAVDEIEPVPGLRVALLRRDPGARRAPTATADRSSRDAPPR